MGYARFPRQLHAAAPLRCAASGPDKRSPAEVAIWPRLEPLGFECQHQRLGYVLDFYHRSFKLAVEIDGRKYHAGREAYDLRRDERFADVDIMTLRIPARWALYQPDRAIARVVAAIEACKHRRTSIKPKRSGREYGLDARLQRAQYHEAKQASDAEREFRRTWVSPFDTSKRGQVTVVRARLAGSDSKAHPVK